METSIKLA